MRLLPFMLELSRKLGPRLEQAWPVLLRMYSDILQLISIFNDGQPLALSRGGGDVVVTSTEGRELVRLLSEGNPGKEHQAKELAAALEHLDSKVLAS